MNFLKTSTLFTLLIACLWSCQKSQISNLTLFSDNIPSEMPLVFGKGIISTEDAKEFAITFSPEMDELFFTRRKPEETNAIYSMKFQGGQWSEPEPAFFSQEEGWDFEPHINPSGDMLYFGSTRLLGDTTKKKGMHQWYSKNGINGWSQPVPLKEPFVDRFSMYITSSRNGNIFFTSNDKGAKPEDGGIYVAKRDGDQYAGVERMGEKVNFSGKWIAHPYIAPDESYIIYDGESPDGFGDCDLYISFNINGSWTAATNLGPNINTEKCEMCSSVSPDGKFLFFQRGDGDEGDIYWVDFEIIREQLGK